MDFADWQLFFSLRLIISINAHFEPLEPNFLLHCVLRRPLPPWFH